MNTKRCSRCKIEKPLTEFRRGGKSTRGDGYYAYCNDCTREYAKAWQNDNPELVKKQKQNDYQRHKEVHDVKSKKWAKDNPEKRREISRRYCELHPDAVTRAVREWRHRNPEKVRQYGWTRQARENGASGNFTHEEWIDLCKRYDNKCVCCGQGDKKLMPDHVVPLSKGGDSYISNIQPLCISCNSRKRDKTVWFIDVEERITTWWEDPKA